MTRPTEQYDPPEDSQSRAAERPSRSRKPAWSMVILALTGLSAALVYLTVGGSHLAAASVSAAPSAASPSLAPSATSLPPGATVATQPRSASALALTGGALPLLEGLKAQAAAWAAGSGGAALAAVSTQVGTVTQAAGVRQYVEMKMACANLASGVTTAQAGPPIPDATMQALYVKALTQLAEGAADCRAAISERSDGDEYVEAYENSTMLHQAMSAFVLGAKDLFQATAEIEDYSHGR